MKKVIFLYIFLILSFSTAYAAEDSCIQESKPTTPGLVEYQKNLDTILYTISKTVSKNYDSRSNDISSQIKTDKNKLNRLFNETIEWNAYESSFEYYVTYPINNDVSYSVKREYRELDKKRQQLNKTMALIAERWYGDVIIEDVCQSIKNNCSIDSTTLFDLWEKIIKNHNRIINTYRKIVIWEISKNEEIPTDLILVSKSNFWLELLNTYSPAVSKKLNSECGWLERAKAIMSQVSFINPEKEKSWIDLWKYQWARVTGKLDSKQEEKEREVEKQLLWQELTRQWIPQDRHTSMVQSLDDFHQNSWFSKNNNPITNSFNRLSKSVVEQWTSFSSSIEKAFEDNDENITLGSIDQVQSESDIDTQIWYSIAELYEYQIPASVESNRWSLELRWKLIQMHNSLNASNNLLQNTCQRAVAACNELNPWVWKCWQCQ